MSEAELARLSPEEKRIAIAEACGWTLCYRTRGDVEGLSSRGIEGIVPDYFGDLNAMHAAEKTLKPSELVGESQLWDRYIVNLFSTGRGTHGFHATAAQRADAFLLTIPLNFRPCTQS